MGRLLKNAFGCTPSFKVHLEFRYQTNIYGNGEISSLREVESMNDMFEPRLCKIVSPACYVIANLFQFAVLNTVHKSITFKVSTLPYPQRRCKEVLLPVLFSFILFFFGLRTLQ